MAIGWCALNIPVAQSTGFAMMGSLLYGLVLSKFLGTTMWTESTSAVLGSEVETAIQIRLATE